MAQLSYNNNMEPGFPGLIADMSFHDILGTIAASEEIAFGLGVKRNTTNARQCDIIDNVADTFLGIAVHDFKPEGKYVVADPVGVLRKGKIWVPVIVTIAVDEAAYVDVATGKLTNVSTGNVSTGGFFRTAVTYNVANRFNISVLDINLP